MVDIRCRAEGRNERRRTASRIKELNDLSSTDGNANDAAFEMGRRGEPARIQNDIVSHDVHAALRILVYELGKIFAEKMKQAFHRKVCGFDLIRVKTDVAVVRGVEGTFYLEGQVHAFV